MFYVNILCFYLCMYKCPSIRAYIMPVTTILLLTIMLPKTDCNSAVYIMVTQFYVTRYFIVTVVLHLCVSQKGLRFY